jgi:UDP-N-acetylmuramate--alanine ligase
VVTNIDPEHLDHYQTFDAVKRAFQGFVESIPFYGFAAVCIDDPDVQEMAARVENRRLVAYGLNPQAQVRGLNLTIGPGGSSFDVAIAGEGEAGPTTMRDVRLPMAGEHNVRNALAAIAVGRELGAPEPVIRKALAEFGGVRRRFTFTGRAGGVTVVDDYGHHPTEIAAVLKAARAITNGRVVAVVQPHRFTRLRDLFQEFCRAFNDADAVIVADVYPAGEPPIAGIDREALVEGLKRHGHRRVLALAGPADLAPIVAGEARDGDLVVLLGAGDITSWAYALPGQLEALGS